MCAKKHTEYRNARKGLLKRSDFTPKKNYFAWKMTENA